MSPFLDLFRLLRSFVFTLSRSFGLCPNLFIIKSALIEFANFADLNLKNITLVWCEPTNLLNNKIVELSSGCFVSGPKFECNLNKHLRA